MATLQQAGLTFVRFGLPALAPFIRADLQLSLAQTGVVLGAFDLGALLAFYATGHATARVGGRSVMAAGALATGVLAGLAALAPSVAVLALILAAAGAGFPSSQVAGSQTVMGSFPLRERGLAMGIRQAGLPLGGLLAAAVLPGMAARWGWRAAMTVAGTGCALAGLATYAGLARAGAESAEQTPWASSGTFWTAPRQFFRNGALVLTTLTACLLAAGQFGLTGYLPLYFVDVFGWGAAQASRLLLLVHAGGTAGRLAWGWLSDRRFGADRVRPLALAAACATGVVVTVTLLPAWTPLPSIAAAGVAALAGFTLLGWNGLYVTLLSETAREAAAVMLGVSLTLLYVFTTVTPPLFGWAVQRAGGRYAVAWLGVAALEALAVVTVLAIRRWARTAELRSPA